VQLPSTGLLYSCLRALPLVSLFGLHACRQTPTGEKKCLGDFALCTGNV